MSNRLFARVVTAGLVATIGTAAGCGDERPPIAPSATLLVTSVFPSSGAAGLTTPVQILGSGFQSGATVTFAGAAAPVTTLSSTSITTTAPIHASGPVDVVVTNPGGLTARLSGGFVYVQIDPPSVSAFQPTRGSTGGGTIVTITGAGFRAGATVTLDGERQTAQVDSSGTIRLTTSAHAAGTVEITVANPDGQFTRLNDRYTYALPQSFDFNGAWEGFALAHPDALPRATPQHSDMDMRFIIENGMLTTFTCGGVLLASPVPRPAKDGSFSQAAEDGRVVLTGRIVADASAVGTIDVADCPATRWSAIKR